MSELRTNRIVPRDGLVSGTGIGGGVIQVKNATVTATETIVCDSAFEDTSVTCSITPTRSDSKILLSLSVTGEGNSTDQRRFTHRIKKVIGGTTTFIAGATVADRVSLLGSTGDDTVDASTSASSFSISNYMDAPATTSAVTYTLQITYQSATAGGTYYLNRNVSDGSGSPRFVSWMTLMEVSG